MQQNIRNTVPVKPTIKFSDLEKIDVRVGTIEKACPRESGDLLLAMPEKPVPDGTCVG